MHNFTSKCIFCVMPLVRTRKFEYTIQRHATNHGSPYHHPCLPTHSRSAQVPLLISALFLLPWSINDGVFGTILDWISTLIKPPKNTIRCNYFAPVPTVQHATRKVILSKAGSKQEIHIGILKVRAIWVERKTSSQHHCKAFLRNFHSCYICSPDLLPATVTS